MNELELNIRSMLTGELLRMVREEADEYTQEALVIALDELKQRNVSPDAPAAKEETAEDFGRQLPQGGSPEQQFHALLCEELQYEESYWSLLEFVDSMSIRNGEYEGARLVVKKMDRDNFILYTELQGMITACLAMDKDRMVGLMGEIAQANELQLENPDEE